MKLIIDIPDNVKRRLDEGHIQNGSIISKSLMNIIKNGTPYEGRPKGKWIDLHCETEIFDNWGECSICGKGIFLWKFCPYCGAEMEVEE